MWGLFQPAMHSVDGWDVFEAALHANPSLTNTRKWAERVTVKLRNQASQRSERPPVYSNGAVEAALAIVRDTIAPCAFAYRNRARLDRMLELMRLAALRVDKVTVYSADIRAHLVALGGHTPRTYREMYDKRDPLAGPAINSLWSMTAQHAMDKTRKAKAAASQERAGRIRALLGAPDKD